MNIPIIIYLQVDPEGDRPDDYEFEEQITWCEDKINGNDVKYLQFNNLKKMLELLKTKAEMPNDELTHNEKVGYVRAINDILNFIKK